MSSAVDGDGDADAAGVVDVVGVVVDGEVVVGIVVVAAVADVAHASVRAILDGQTQLLPYMSNPQWNILVS